MVRARRNFRGLLDHVELALFSRVVRGDPVQTLGARIKGMDGRAATVLRYQLVEHLQFPKSHKCPKPVGPFSLVQESKN